MLYDCYYSRINQGEVRTTLQNMGRNKAIGPDQIPIEAWRCLEDEGVKWLTCLFKKIFSSTKIPDKWSLRRYGVSVPALKDHEGNKINTPYPGNPIRRIQAMEIKYSGRYQTWFLLQEIYNTPYRRLSICHDIVLIAELTEGLNNRLESWREALEDNGLRVSREKTKYLRCDFGRVAIISAMLYGSECWPITKAQANKVEVAELRMVERRPQTASVRRVEALLVDGSRRRGRPKLRWEDRLKQDTKELLLSEDMTTDRNAR
ncbi:hypothetical protein Tco_0800201 [Tanacetum coccineum]|uniref:Reverse transcriptase n=1 Tax=Tanacetum coccineum TaxID=301880 RepID=A0ABQ4ZWV2_9ASTR